jgi:hypothetical protein
MMGTAVPSSQWGYEDELSQRLQNAQNGARHLRASAQVFAIVTKMDKELAQNVLPNNPRSGHQAS